MWYPSFSSHSNEEGGACVTSPLSAISAHFAIPGVDMEYYEAADVDVEIMGSSTKEWCCAIWFPGQDGCALKEDHDVLQVTSQQQEDDSSDDIVVCWDERDYHLSNDAQEEGEAYYYFYPVFRDAYEESGCAMANNNNEGGEFTTKSGQPLHSSWLHSSHAGCCQEWFGEQESQSCLINFEEASSAAKSRRRPSEVNEGINVTMTPGKAVVC